MPRRANAIFLLIMTLFGALRLQCHNSGFTFWTSDATVPWQERLWRAADFLLFEPGYAQATRLSEEWFDYTEKFLHDEKRIAELENLANEPAILGYLSDPQGSLAVVFEKETSEVLANFGNGAIKAWRLRSLDGKIALAKAAERLKTIDSSTVRQDIGPRFFSIPIRGAGYNYSLDAEWDISQLSDFPLSRVNSEYLYLTTDKDLNILSNGKMHTMPDSASRFISGNKFIEKPYGLSHSLRILSAAGKDFRLIICYPFAGYLFYAIRGSLLLLLILTAIVVLTKLRPIRSAAAHALENRSGAWLKDHYKQSLGINEQALHLGEKTLGVVSALQEREAKVIGELGKHIAQLNANFTAQSRLLIEETQRAQSVAAPVASPPEERPKFQRPLHKKHIPKPAIHIEANTEPEIDVSIELDLPLQDEKQLKSDDKAFYISSLRRRAQEKSGVDADFIRDDKLDNYEYTVPDLLKPVESRREENGAPKSVRRNAETAELENAQKFNYSGKSRVLPMAESAPKPSILRMREDLQRQSLHVSEEE